MTFRQTYNNDACNGSDETVPNSMLLGKPAVAAAFDVIVVPTTEGDACNNEWDTISSNVVSFIVGPFLIKNFP